MDSDLIGRISSNSSGFCGKFFGKLASSSFLARANTLSSASPLNAASSSVNVEVASSSRASKSKSKLSRETFTGLLADFVMVILDNKEKKKP